MNEWQEEVAGEWVFAEETRRLRVMSEKEARVYCASQPDEGDDRLVKIGIGEFEVKLPRGAFVRFESEGRVWIKLTARAQDREKASNEVFTSLDRPAPMSPEMQMMMRFQRQNEIARQQMYERLEDALRRRNDDLPKTDKRVGETAAASAKTAVRAKPKRGATDVEKSRRDPGLQTPERDGISGNEEAGNDGGDEVLQAGA